MAAPAYTAASMRRLATFALLALLGTSAAPFLSPNPQDCCPMGGDMSCCPNRGASDTGCGLRQCAPDGDGGGGAPASARAILTNPPAGARRASSGPVVEAA